MLRFLAPVLRATLLLSALGYPYAAHAENQTKHKYTSLVAHPLTSTAIPILGTDGKYHVAYELIMENASRRLPATLTTVEIVSGENQNKTIATLSGEALSSNLFTLPARPAKSHTIAISEGRLLAVNLAFKSSDEIPHSVIHRISAEAADNPGAQEPVSLTLTIGQISISKPQQLVIGPPLTGKNWVAINGCCKTGFPHRMSALPIDGKLVIAQRFAIDWMRLNDDGKLVDGPIDDVRSWVGYGSKVHAIADATVVHVTNTLDDQTPGTLPDPQTLTLETLDGNGVVLDLGDGHFAFYAHMQKGSVTVKVGDKVKRGDVIGLLGNSGNTSAPHLHIHIMTGPSPLADNGVPYLINAFSYAGQVSRKEFLASENLTNNLGKGRIDKDQPYKNTYPLQLNIIDFP